MSVHVPDAVQRHLHRGERVEWYGRPRQGFFLRGIDSVLIPAGAVAAAIGTEILLAFAIGGSSLFATVVFGGTFCGGGHFHLWGRFLVDRSVRSGLHYAITDRRCLIVSTRLRRVSRTLPRRHQGLRVKMLDNGLGTIWLDPAWQYSSPRSIYHWFSCFEQIADAGRVFELVRFIPPEADSGGADTSRPLTRAAPQTRKSPGT